MPPPPTAELRSPLNIVIGMVTLALADERLHPQTSGYLTDALGGANALLELIDKVLEFTRLSRLTVGAGASGGKGHGPGGGGGLGHHASSAARHHPGSGFGEAMDIARMAADLADTVRAAADSRGVEVLVLLGRELTLEPPPLFSGDAEVRRQQIFLLLSTAPAAAAGAAPAEDERNLRRLPSSSSDARSFSPFARHCTQGFMRCMVQLVENGIRFTPAGGFVTVRISVLNPPLAARRRPRPRRVFPLPPPARMGGIVSSGSSLHSPAGGASTQSSLPGGSAPKFFSVRVPGAAGAAKLQQGNAPAGRRRSKDIAEELVAASTAAASAAAEASGGSPPRAAGGGSGSDDSRSGAGAARRPRRSSGGGAAAQVQVLQVQVEDTGVGIPLSEQHRILKPFSQARRQSCGSSPCVPAGFMTRKHSAAYHPATLPLPVQSCSPLTAIAWPAARRSCRATT